jgi:hypothetical protein
MLPKGRVFSETVEEHVEEDKLIEIASGPTKKIDRNNVFSFNSIQIV